jgi:cytochrome P450
MANRKAGSDTTSTTMAALLFYLSRYPAAYRLATQEIRSTFTSVSEIRAGPKLNSCTYLRACIDETMRISPPVGGSLWREVDTGGAVIDGIPIPKGVDVGTGIYALHHNPSLYVEPDVYKPERWLRTKGAANSGAARVDSGIVPYSPFSVGPRSCIGKPLALMELMLTMVTLLWKFDFRDEDERWHAVDQGEREVVKPGLFKLKDHITSAKDGPILQFAFREGI